MESGSPRGRRAAILAGAIALGLLAVVLVDAIGGDGDPDERALDRVQDTSPTVLGSVVEGTLPEAPPASPVVLEVEGGSETTDEPGATASPTTTAAAPTTTATQSTEPQLIPPTVIENTTTTTSEPTTTSAPTTTSETTTTEP